MFVDQLPHLFWKNLNLSLDGILTETQSGNPFMAFDDWSQPNEKEKKSLIKTLCVS